jgi:hypothetical protein
LKKVTLSLSNNEGIATAEKSLNALSGVVAVDIIGNQAVAHCGDRLDKNVLLNTVNNADMRATIVSETADE